VVAQINGSELMPEKVNILLVDDQPAKLLSYEVVLRPLGQNLIRAASARDALVELLKTEIAVILIDVEMPEIDGFQLAAMIREHPRFSATAIIFVSAVHLTQEDIARGYAMGAIEYAAVPVIPEVLRAKVRVFVDLYRKTRELQYLNDELEQRVAERTAELEASTRRQAILSREVDHRAKNAMAVVQSIVRLTQARNIDEYMSTLEGRIGALARNHTLLSESRWEGSNLLTIIEEELAPYRTNDPNRLTVSGPSIVLQPAASQNLALAIHELATNAAKYGALSAPQGRLSVVLSLQPNALVIEWDETGGPEISEPQTTGFGAKLIAASMNQHRGTFEFEWARSGLKCRLTIPRGTDVDGNSTGKSATTCINMATGSDHRPTALVVEDEPLIGMMIADHLAEFNFKVLGPFQRIDEAFSAVNERELDVALLDINLGGTLVYPIASRLREMNVPFIFISGYAADGVDDRFAGTPLLQKPVDKQQLFQTVLSVTGRAKPLPPIRSEPAPAVK